jgi:serine phosphatase RsbU (regulator of sigma subunit)
MLFKDSALAALPMPQYSPPVGASNFHFAPASTATGLHLLVVEAASSPRLVENWLLASGMAEAMNVERTESLADALDILAETTPDLILLDLHLADGEGLAVFRALQRAASQTPIVIMSGALDEDLARTAVREGAQDYVVKADHQHNPLLNSLRLALERMRRQQLEALLRNAGEQLAIAQSVQEHLYPEAPPELPGFDIAGHCIAGEGIAGDYFDYLPLQNATGIVVGDVMGHGYDAALVMAGVRGVLRALAHTYTDVGELLLRANRVLAPDLAERFVTVLFTAIDPVTPALHFAAAGHAGFLLDGEGQIKARLQATAPPLGVGDPATLSSDSAQLEPGDLLLLYTDGVSESSDPAGALFGDEGVLRVIRQARHCPAKEIVERLLQAARAHAGGLPQLDDMTVVVAKYVGV